MSRTKTRRAVDDPLCDLLTAPATEHDARRVEAAPEVEAAQIGGLAEERLVVGRERLGAAYFALDSCKREEVCMRKLERDFVPKTKFYANMLGCAG